MNKIFPFRGLLKSLPHIREASGNDAGSRLFPGTFQEKYHENPRSSLSPKNNTTLPPCAPVLSAFKKAPQFSSKLMMMLLLAKRPPLAMTIPPKLSHYGKNEDFGQASFRHIIHAPTTDYCNIYSFYQKSVDLHLQLRGFRVSRTGRRRGDGLSVEG